MVKSQRSVVYQVLDAPDVRLYVGMTWRDRWPRRWWDHVDAGRRFVGETVSIEISDHDTRREARNAEAWLIAHYRPRYNRRRPKVPDWFAFNSFTRLAIRRVETDVWEMFD